MCSGEPDEHVPSPPASRQISVCLPGPPVAPGGAPERIPAGTPYLARAAVDRRAARWPGTMAHFHPPGSQRRHGAQGNGEGAFSICQSLPQGGGARDARTITNLEEVVKRDQMPQSESEAESQPFT
ncbi:hypothetical protein AAFF_G00268230 [Aldrovandia affinis]|uniref:Uncharacterized protein n=1 Tax=Aldrovandia affinis TaxID=143900 RepID=A0AAD7SS19_9TELE|nr:hypothetical protein AAFF_G00268230 [Aldrovandia affinis]